MSLPPLSLVYDPQTGTIEGFPAVERWLNHLEGCFADQTAYQAALSKEDSLVYRVTNVEVAQGDGQLHYSIGILMPGRVGKEYYQTKGHLHAWRPAAEVYIGLGGHGLMLLEDEITGESTVATLAANTAVYVPGHTAHRTVNTGGEPLVYWGILHSSAGHDYDTIARRDFRKVIAEVAGQPTLIDRDEYLPR